MKHYFLRRGRGRGLEEILQLQDPSQKSNGPSLRVGFHGVINKATAITNHDWYKKSNRTINSVKCKIIVTGNLQFYRSLLLL